MEVIVLQGTENRLYELVARLVMDPDVLRQNNNYPFKTTPKYTWHVCIENDEVIGFMPVKPTSGGIYLDNYYIRDNNPDILSRLIDNILSVSDQTVTILCRKKHTELLRQRGFVTCTIFAQYNKMQYANRKGDHSQ